MFVLLSEVNKFGICKFVLGVKNCKMKFLNNWKSQIREEDKVIR